MLFKNSFKLFSTFQHSKYLAGKVAGSRQLSVSTKLNDSFKVQDLKDFKEKVTESKTPVIVDFFATWCGPCRLLTPRIEAVIAEKAGKVNLAKVDIDELTDLALEYEVSSVPVLVAIKDGKEQTRMVGLQDLDQLRAFVDKLAPS